MNVIHFALANIFLNTCTAQLHCHVARVPDTESIRAFASFSDNRLCEDAPLTC